MSDRPNTEAPPAGGPGDAEDRSVEFERGATEEDPTTLEAGVFCGACGRGVPPEVDRCPTCSAAPEMFRTVGDDSDLPLVAANAEVQAGPGHVEQRFVALNPVSGYPAYDTLLMAEAVAEEHRGWMWYSHPERCWWLKSRRSGVWSPSDRGGEETRVRETLRRELGAGVMISPTLIRDVLAHLRSILHSNPDDDQAAGVVSLVDWDVPEPEWRIEGVLPKIGVGQLTGPAGSGKTSVAVGLAMCLATGRADWHGHKVLQSGPVLYVPLEDPIGVSARARGWLRENGGDGKNFHVWQGDLHLGRTSTIRRLVSEVTAAGVRPGVVVIDTQADATAGIEENDNTAMAVPLAKMQEISRQLGCFVLVLHHTGWSVKNRPRGASAQLAKMDLEVIVKDERGQRSLEVTKVKNAAPPPNMSFTLAQTGDTVWAKPGGAGASPGPAAGGGVQLNDSERVTWDTLRLSPNDSWWTVADLESTTGRSRRTVERALRTLMAKLPGAMETRPGAKTAQGTEAAAYRAAAIMRQP
jgi:hypothetical protein